MFSKSPSAQHTTRQRIKTILLVLCVMSFFVVPVFAAGTKTTPLLTLQDRLHTLIGICSRGWIVLAILAGKLMTNERVYGSFMHLDIYLWKMWNIMKNFANFALLGLLLWEIIKGITGKSKLDAKKVIINTLIAGILIQASRFLMGALLDVSSIAVSAVAAFPSSFLVGDGTLTSTITSEVKDTMYNQKYVRNLSAASNVDNIITSLPNETNVAPLSTDDSLQAILPNGSSVSGPFIFLGMSVFRFQDYIDTGNSTVEAITIGFMLKAIIIIFYTLGLALLLISNLIRVVFLRVFIILSPILILVKVFFDDKAGGDNKMLKNFSVNSLLSMVFRPVLFVLSLSFALIVIVSFQKIMTDVEGKPLNGVQMTSNADSSTLQVQDLSSLQISNGTLFKKAKTGIQNTFSDLIVFLLSIFLVRYLIKWSITTGEGPGTETMKKMTGFLEQTAGTLPIFGGFSFSQVSAMSDQTRKNMLKPLHMNKSGEFQENREAFQNRIDTLMGIYTPWQESDFAALRNIYRSGGDTFFDKSRDIGKSREEGLSLGVGKWKSVLEDMLKSPGNAKKYGFEGTYNGSSATAFEDFFKGNEPNQINNRRHLHELMGGNGALTHGYFNKDSFKYEDLMANVYGKPRGKRTESDSGTPSNDSIGSDSNGTEAADASDGDAG